MQLTRCSAALYNVLTQFHHHAHHLRSALLSKRQILQLIHILLSAHAVYFPLRLQFHRISPRSSSRYAVALSFLLLKLFLFPSLLSCSDHKRRFRLLFHHEYHRLACTHTRSQAAVRSSWWRAPIADRFSVPPVSISCTASQQHSFLMGSRCPHNVRGTS